MKLKPLAPSALATFALALGAAASLGAAPPLHPNGPKETCPPSTLALPGNALVGAVPDAPKEAPSLYPHANLKGLKASSASAGSSGNARVKCGRRIQARTVTVKL